MNIDEAGGWWLKSGQIDAGSPRKTGLRKSIGDSGTVYLKQWLGKSSRQME